MRILILLFILIIQASAAYAADSMLVLDQTNNIYGHLNVYLSDIGLRAERKNGDYCFICAAPSWDMVIFSDKNKKIFRYPFVSWRKKGFPTALTLEENDNYYQNMIKKEEIIEAGLKCDHYIYVRDRAIVRGELVVYHGAAGAVNAQRALCTLYDLPYVRGIPLRFRRKGKIGFGRMQYAPKETMRSVLKTEKSQVLPLKKALFQPPQHYKPASDGEVLFPEKVDELFDVTK